MKLIWISWCAALAVLGTSAVAQNTDQQELPSAPSAVQEQQKQSPRSAPATARSPAPQSSSIQELKPIGQEPAQPPPAPPPPQSKPTNPAPEEQATPSATPPPTDTKPPASSDSADSTDADSALTIKKTVNEVNVVFVVTDKHGHYVKDLKKDDFRVLDDNKPAKEIRSFRNETDLPLQVGLLVDASNSVRDRFKFEQEAAIEFLNQIIRPSYDKAFVIGFDTTPEVTQDFTDNTELLSRGVRALRAGGGTAMYDALYFACRDKLKNAPRKGPVRRAIILLSDGEDNQSRVTREEAIEMAQRAEVIVYTISTNVSGAKRQGDKILERIADATGGRAFFPFQLRDVSNDFAEIQNELRSQYALAYIPDDFRSDGRFRTIQITADQKSFHVRSRRGYYAPAQ